MKTMTEKEIREWVEATYRNSIVTYVIDFARHVGALREPVVKYQYLYKKKDGIIWLGIIDPKTEEEIKAYISANNFDYQRLDFTRTEE